MTNKQDSHNTSEIKPANQISHESQCEQPNNVTETPAPDSGSVSVSNNDNRKVSRQDIELVQNLIERCLQLYMNRDEVVTTLLSRARIDPGFTTLVWQKLEEENAGFFRAYYIRLKLKKQIILFNNLLEHQCHLMKYPAPLKVPLSPIQNGIHPMAGWQQARLSRLTSLPIDLATTFKVGVGSSAVNNLPMGYPVIQQPPVPAAGQHHFDSTGYTTSSCPIVNGVPAPGNSHPVRMMSGNECKFCFLKPTLMIDTSLVDVSPAMPPNNEMSSMSDMPVSPTSVASTGHFPFSASEISGIGVETSTLNTAFTSDVESSIGLQLPLNNVAGTSRDSLRSLAQIPWNFSLSDLTADLSNLGDLGALGNYPGSPFLPSDSDILLESPEQDDIVEEFFVDSVPGQPCPTSDEEKS